MEYIFGPALVLAVSLGYTQFKIKKCEEAHKDLTTKIEQVDLDTGRKVLASVVPITKSIKELQTFTGIR
jgi:hypothetical protein